MKSFALAIVATICLVSVMGIRNPSQRIVSNLQAHKSMAKMTAQQTVDKYFAKAMHKAREEWECQDECREFDEGWSEYPWDECMGCWEDACVDECQNCWDMECPEM